MRFALALLPLAFGAVPALAQQGHEGHGTPPPALPPAQAADPHAGHAMPPPAPAADKPPASDPHAGHVMPDMAKPADAEPSAQPPQPPTDHAADAIYDPADMARARLTLRRENGAFNGSMILFDLAEYQARKGGDGYRWEGEAWFGGDIDRLLVKTEGEGNFGEPPENAEVQLLYSRAISPYWNAHVGVRYDIRPDPSRTYTVIGIEGIAPYWFHLSGQFFLSDKGEVRLRAEGSYDLRLTQTLIVTPRAEVNLSAQDMPRIGIGSGLTNIELGFRLRYEIRPEFAPYIGVEWSGKTGATARLARMAGEDPTSTSIVAGIRFWF